MPLVLNLEKSKASLQLSLQKVGVVTPPEIDMAFVLDVSGSFEDEHRSGITNDLMTRLVPWGLTFDPDRKLDVITFSNGPQGVHEVGAVTAQNYAGFVHAHIIDRVPGWCGATDYSYAIESALRGFGWLDNAPRKASFFGKLMGQQDEAAKARRRSLAVFVTDGDNADPARTLEVLRASEARRDAVYFLFLGISNQGSRFPFLEKIGDAFGNTGFVAIDDLRSFVAMSDEELNAALLQPELLDWMKP